MADTSFDIIVVGGGPGGYVAAIINPPQAMILAVGAGEERVVARNGQMVIRNMMSCTLAVDHRVVDGAMGAQFLQTLRAYIEQPAAMLV